MWMNAVFFQMDIVTGMPCALIQMGVISVHVILVSLAMEGHVSVCESRYIDASPVIIIGNFWLDVNECAAGLHSCGENANCIDTIGGYNCSCKPMFFESADGKTCIGLASLILNFM